MWKGLAVIRKSEWKAWRVNAATCCFRAVQTALYVAGFDHSLLVSTHSVWPTVFDAVRVALPPDLAPGISGEFTL